MKPSPVQDWLIQPDGLATRLRAVRTQAGLAGKELAAAVGWQASKVSRIENGRQLPNADDTETWVRACQASEEELQALLDLTSGAEAVHLDWKHRYRRGQAAVQANYKEIVANAEAVCHFETVFIPGLLQVPAYARHVLKQMAAPHDLGPEDLDEAVDQRMQRQEYLYDRSKRFEFLLAEPVLRWLICPPAVMRVQLDRLLTAATLPNVRFGILPMGTELGTIPQNSFQLYDELAIVETVVGETTHQADEAAVYAEALEAMWADALIGDQARSALIRASEALPSGE